ncbi:MAG TPA: preprotein translocase subunit SecE [Caulobacteraceae bacterium]|nr:preprotein translocase subunit SecE [Caulobacteraceae bacterium]
MAKDQGAIPTNIRPRGASRAPAPPPKSFSLVDWVNAAPKFFREVRAEARKVTWTSWKETWITSTMVGIMVVIAALFFFSVDGVFSFLISQALKLGNLGS